MSAVVNPLTGDDLPEKSADLVRQLRGVRRGARNASRSGHPGRRAEAQRVASTVAPDMIREVYVQDARGK